MKTRSFSRPASGAGARRYASGTHPASVPGPATLPTYTRGMWAESLADGPAAHDLEFEVRHHFVGLSTENMQTVILILP